MQKTIVMITSYIARILFRERPTEKLSKSLTLPDLESLARYDGTLPYSDKRVRALVWEVKYYKDSVASSLAGEYLAQLLLAEAVDVVGVPLLLPMPMHKTRRKERGHNQTEVLCESALRDLRKNRSKNSLGAAEDFFDTIFSYDPYTLQRIKHTLPQQGLERSDRLKNVKTSMQVSDASKVRGRVCVVVDDVTTTGASFAEAKRALYEAGASEVRCIALAQS